MAPWEKISNVWKNVQEVDLRPIRQEAEKEMVFALVGAPEAGKADLAAQLRADPSRPGEQTYSPVISLDLEDTQRADEADLIILLISGTSEAHTVERELAREWITRGLKLIVFYNTKDLLPAETSANIFEYWGPVKVLHGAADDQDYLLNHLAPVILEMFPKDHLALGRRYPLLRGPIVRQLINDTCFSNAAYALATGIAEVVPVLDIPLNITDVIVLTKAQALLVYRLGLTLGLPSDWRYYLGEFGGVIGGSFFWRQVARQLVGLIPVWGIIPKVSVAYAGTYVVGHVVWRWYLTGRHVTRKEMRELYRQAFARGKSLAKNLSSRLPRPQFKFRRPRKAALPSPDSRKVCSRCNTQNEIDAVFCKRCGERLTVKDPDRLPDA